MFAEPGSDWVLKGGAGLLIRLPSARYSQDLDLLHRSNALPDALDELRQVCTRILSAELDPFSFAMGEPTLMRGGVSGAQVSITGSVGGREFGRFPIDLTTELHFVAALEHHVPPPLVVIDDVAPLPPITLYPLPDQIADKVCAMAGHHGDGVASTRYRELVLPETLNAPSPTWASGYRTAAQDLALPAGARTLTTALDVVGRCLNPLLSGTTARGTWRPTE